EQRKKVGIPDHCAGLISASGLRSLGLGNLPNSVIQNPNVKGAKFYSPNGKDFLIKRNSVQALVVDRSLFDQYLLERAKEQGVTVLLESKVTNITYTKNTRKVRINYKDLKKREEKIATSFVSILASGARQHLLQKMNVQPIPRKRIIPGYQVIVENVGGLEVEYVELFMSNKIAPGLFAWIIPINETTAKVGLASSEKLTIERMNYFLKKHPLTKERFKKSKITKKFGGQILINGMRKKSVFDGVMLAGDVAGQTKATTGGGVITGGLAGAIAGKTASEALERNNNSKRFLKAYEKQWKELLWNQLKNMATFRWLVNRLSDKAVELAFETIIDNGLDQLIEKTADIDKQSAVLNSLLQHPAIIKLAFRVLPHLQW
ncbi:MAG: NAD(P)/FAD-dependent oxidoreductase, partial [Candidatus Heimdallarchaeota archaeon]